MISLGGHFNYRIKSSRLTEINTELEKPSIWNNPELMQNLIKERTALNVSINPIKQVSTNLEEINDLFLLAIEINEKKTFTEVIGELNNIDKKIAKIEFYAMFCGKDDNKDCYIDLQSGSGGTDAQDWTNILLRMYLRWAIIKGFKTEVIEKSEGEIAGIKAATIHISGNYSFGWLRTETGVHRLVRKSPFNAAKRRHTSFSSIFVYPVVDDDTDIIINPLDLRIDVYRASGAGGQHVNRTESAVRITHIPTGTVTQCQNDRSQHRNKNQAMKQMKSKLYEIQAQKKKLKNKI
ncbi:peptide chain release factor 2 [Candidatus Ishikawaella capsulata Mpkobe]|uniref:Peptide chain release factor 2 n=1 Tax=Candidatus Ishikawaella capsulata Mpkobe TaxID=476281 RepID=C5WCF2_9ENTR|nr:peptide chain release factor 2 [Candidatus Ishikawaella capsulata Mpkobe]